MRFGVLIVAGCGTLYTGGELFAEDRCIMSL